ncbi:hypothetical protein O0I10_007228 [Lichtheimia ornata]|uniref:Cyclin-like domain-containing protein n=1 Tax=Lichtheimia ornata TaxID=688661 RepID=A0AAD7V1Y5_9FUNG|nr:uncharacterized protein O0I10_007228 [Lichtheimia ornata]KAJ8657148.1 hypothetical protein O0I10_007228 [Lichtheimia ornata]
MDQIASSQWVFTTQELQHLPSIVAGGLTVNEERRRRLAGCTFIHSIGSRLEVPLLTIATAMTYFHRFYTRHSFTHYRFEVVAATCVYLACKVEESMRKIKDVVAASLLHMHSRENHEDEMAKLFHALRDAIIQYEFIVVETLCFDFAIDHPHQALLDLLDELEASERIAQAAWSFANDSMRLVLCLSHEPRHIAAACILLAYRLHRQDIPEIDDSSLMVLIEDRFETLDAIIQEIMHGRTLQQQLERRNRRRSTADSPATSSGSNRARGSIVSANGHRIDRERASNMGSSALQS